MGNFDTVRECAAAVEEKGGSFLSMAQVSRRASAGGRRPLLPHAPRALWPTSTTFIRLVGEKELPQDLRIEAQTRRHAFAVTFATGMHDEVSSRVSVPIRYFLRASVIARSLSYSSAVILIVRC